MNVDDAIPPLSDALKPPMEVPVAAGEILAVDDNPNNLLAIETALEGVGSRIVCANSGEQALRYLLEQDFALVLLDVQMPSMDGFQTAQLIRTRERSKRTPIIFVTAYDSDAHDVIQAYSMGAVDFLYKPIVPTVLRAKASVLIDLQRQTAEVARHAATLRQQELQLHQKELREQRQRWEEEALRLQMEEQRSMATQMAEKARQLAELAEERRCAQEQLTTINQQLADSDRRKDEFLAVLAHELRNPLAPIVSSVDLIGLSLEAAEPNKETLTRATQVVKRQVRHLTRLVDDLLDISRITSGKIELKSERLDLGEVVRHAVAMSRPLIDERGQHLSVDLAASTAVAGDSVRLAQVVANLLNNAARYTQAGGRISLTTEVVGDHVLVRVKDNGQGIEPAMLPRIFDTFVQVRTDGTGLGLGLTLVRRLVELHGGRVTAASPGLGQGSEFLVSLPLTTEEETDARPSSHTPTPEPPSLRIVVVEDNDDVREMLQSVLEFHGHQVTPVDSGERGIETIIGARPDLAVVDIGLPDISGYDVARAVREKQQMPPPYMIAMTGFGQEKDREAALKAGFNQHLTKPVDVDRLKSVLAAAYDTDD